MIKHFPKIMKDIKLQIQESQRTPSSINTNKNNQAYSLQVAENQRERNNLKDR